LPWGEQRGLDVDQGAAGQHGDGASGVYGRRPQRFLASGVGDDDRDPSLASDFDATGLRIAIDADHGDPQIVERDQHARAEADYGHVRLDRSDQPTVGEREARADDGFDDRGGVGV
jgi:hypothetical protein